MTVKRKRELRLKFGNKCSRCGGTEKLQFHHLNSRIRGGNNHQKNLLLLCKGCHRKEHIMNEGKYKLPLKEYRKKVNEDIKDYYKRIKDVWVPDRIAWHQWRIEEDEVTSSHALKCGASNDNN